jgi:glutamyl-Q tRNA(Asp) synthetase
VAYVGRFAPSPTGPLHIGSLTTAVASYLDAKRHGGRWLVRIEDIDPPREQPGAAAAILRTLEALALHWDGPVVYQSTRLAAYERTVEQLLQQGLAYYCSCTRSDVRAVADKGPLGYRYPGTCRNRMARQGPAAVRARVDTVSVCFEDRLQGSRESDLGTASGDYVIWRRDAMPAYHLAVVLDDAAQGVTDVVRGVDLLETTAVHLHLQGLLGIGAPRYAHVPIVTNHDAQKLSKQNGAQAVDPKAPGLALEILGYLGLEPPRDLRGAPCRELWPWASSAWSLDTLRGRASIKQR